MLTVQQIETFKRDGAVILRGFFSPREVQDWREEIDRYFQFPATGDEWRAALRKHQSDNFHLGTDPTPVLHSALRDVYRTLHATASWTGENELLVRPAEEPVPWMGARAPHLDFPIAAPIRTLANNVIYLSDVYEHGGSFMYWPGSHHIAWEYFRHHPLDYLSQGERSQDQTFEVLGHEMTRNPVEFTGQAGDLLIWHSLLFHSASVNTRAETRLALFGRWGVPLAPGDEKIYNFDRDMWAYWVLPPAETVAETPTCVA
jgi:hypothetical protein